MTCPSRLFDGPVYDTPSGPLSTRILTVEDRLRIVASTSSVDALRVELEAPGLQKTVRVAIERRLRKLGAGAESAHQS